MAKIMIVDDNNEGTHKLARSLYEAGHTTITVRPEQTVTFANVQPNMQPDILLVNKAYIEQIRNYEWLKSRAHISNEYLRSPESSDVPLVRVTMTPARYVTRLLEELLMQTFL